MKLFAVVLLGAAGCASQVWSVPQSSSEFAPESHVGLAAAPVSSDAEATIASLPTGSTATRRWAGAGADDATEVRVTAPRESDAPLREERLVGSNEQPEWTTERTFATTRAYVIAPGQIEIEQWYKLQNPRGSAPNHFWQTEVAFGFEGGWQVDLYENYGKEPDGPTKHQGAQFEVRKALADWGRIPLNPTLYAEYVQNHRAPDKVEMKLLLAEELCSGWHWAGNLVYEKELGDLRTTELSVASGIMHTLLDSKFSAGVEVKAERVTGIGFRSSHDADNEFLIGPSFQWRPTENTHLDVVPLFGLTKSDRRDPRTEIYIVFGIDIGPEREGRRGPVSTSSK